MNETLLEIKDLVIHYETDSGVVEAVNGMNLVLNKASLWAWWARPALGKPLPPWESCGFCPTSCPDHQR